MRVILDAMGGDHAPAAPVAGALMALEQSDVEVILVGRETEIRQALQERGCETLPQRLRIVDAPEVVPGDCDPTQVVREYRQSSMIAGLTMLRDGEGDAFLSAGSTGALITGATLVVKRIRGIRRAALGVELPTMEPGVTTLLCDCGANAECTTEYLLQFAYMSAFYMQHVRGLGRKARVALLNNGTENHKGTELHRKTHALLQEAHAAGRIDYVGNMEARDALAGKTDVLVCDGFSGNVLLKTAEGVVEYMTAGLKEVFYRNGLSKLAALLVKDGIRRLKKKLDYREIGATPLLGIAKPVLKAHGSSNGKAFCSAVLQAASFAAQGVVEEIIANVEFMKVNTTAQNGD